MTMKGKLMSLFKVTSTINSFFSAPVKNKREVKCPDDRHNEMMGYRFLNLF